MQSARRKKGRKEEREEVQNLVIYDGSYLSRAERRTNAYSSINEGAIPPSEDFRFS